MAFVGPRILAVGFRPRHCINLNTSVCVHRRTFLGVFRKIKKKVAENRDPTPVISQDNLFHPFSKSPFPAVRARGEAIQKLAPCPICASEVRDASPKAVKFECPDCGWPTHCSEEHWKVDEQHAKYCGRLREVNEDEHDLRSGRRVWEFEFPGPQGYEEAISFANWDTFWYTRQFRSMDTERSRRHVSKVLTYPITIGSVLHQYSGLTTSNQRVTPEGSRSLAALRSTLHAPIGAPETEELAVGKPQVRVFILGARAESSLPPHCWDQLCLLFPAAQLHLFFIGPQVSLPRSKEAEPAPTGTHPTADEKAQTSASDKADTVPSSKSEEPVTNAGSSSSDNFPSSATASTPPIGSPSPTTTSSALPSTTTPTYLPNVYEPPTPAPIVPKKFTRDSISVYGVPSYTTPYKLALTLTGIQASYMDVHDIFHETYDPYSDVFFFFCPGFGFPSPVSTDEVTGEPLLQIASPTEWGPVLPLLLETKCAIFVTGFSPADVERDVRSLSTPGVAGQFDWLITPGQNMFGSEKWEVADFDPRVMVRTNWGIWGIRGKGREIRERDEEGMTVRD